MRSDRERLLDIQESIERIEKYASRGKEIFEKDELIQTWIIHYFQIIGEAVRALSSNIKNKHPEIAWAKINGMRNILVHGYFGIDTEIVWLAVKKDLLPLKKAIENILEKETLD